MTDHLTEWIERLQEELERVKADRDALVKSCLQQYHNGRWGAHLGNSHVGVFDTKDEAIREIFGCLGLDAAPVEESEGAS